MPEKEGWLKWTLKTVGEGLLWMGGYYATDLLQLFPDHTFANQVALPAGFFIGFVFRKALETRKNYQVNSNKLPDGIKRAMDKIPDSVTGIKDSK